MINSTFHVIDFNPKPITIVSLNRPLFNLDDVNLLCKLDNFEIKDLESSTLFSKNDQILNNDKYKLIRKTIDEVVSEYLKNILNVNNTFKMTHSWVTKNIQGAQHKKHRHPNVMLSTVCYFNEDLEDEDFAPIVFYGDGIKNVFTNFQFKFDVNNPNNYNSSSWSVTPKLNQIIIFPAHMQHSSLINMSKRTRYCLGTNYFLDGCVAQGLFGAGLNIKLEESN
jgi:uncharacterized protein (TIGR02466 family)